MARSRLRGNPVAKAAIASKTEIGESRLQALAEDEAVLLREIEERNERLLSYRAEASAIMSNMKISSFPTRWGTHKFVPPGGRATSVIDVSKLFKLLPLKDFMLSVKAIKKDTEKFLSGKELESITTTTEPTPKPPEYSFEKA